jgi:hypothetical protein
MLKKLVFYWHDENSRIRIQDPHPDPLVGGMDPRIRIRIHPKMSWIRNLDPKYLRGVAGGVDLVEKRRHITESPEQLVSFGTATTVLSESQLIPSFSFIGFK